MVAMDAVANQISTADNTFRELVQVEDNLKTIQKLCDNAQCTKTMTWTLIMVLLLVLFLLRKKLQVDSSITGNK